MKNFGVFSSKTFFFLLTLLRVMRQDINSCIYVTLVVINLKMIMRQLLCLPNLTKTNTFCVHKTRKVVVIGKDKNLMFAAFEIVPPSLQSLNNC